MTYTFRPFTPPTPEEVARRTALRTKDDSLMGDILFNERSIVTKRSNNRLDRRSLDQNFNTLGEKSFETANTTIPTFDLLRNGLRTLGTRYLGKDIINKANTHLDTTLQLGESIRYGFVRYNEPYEFTNWSQYAAVEECITELDTPMRLMAWDEVIDNVAQLVHEIREFRSYDSIYIPILDPKTTPTVNQTVQYFEIRQGKVDICKTGFQPAVAYALLTLQNKIDMTR